MTAQWHLARNRQKYGPYSLDQLRQLAANGQVLPTDMLLQDGVQKWQAVSSVPGLFGTPTGAEERVVEREVNHGTPTPDDDAAEREALRRELAKQEDDVVAGAEQIKALNRNSPGAPEHIMEGYRRALRTHDLMVQEYPDSWKIWYSRGLVLAYGIGDKAAGLESLRRALALAPNEPRIKQSIKDLESNCFIATAAYGSPFAKNVQLMREFRDDILLNSRVGRVLVNWYEKLSPGLARQIERTPNMKPIVRCLLVPVVLSVTVTAQPV